MNEWREFRIWYATSPNPDDLFRFKKTHLLTILAKYDIEDFLILDEPEFVLLRIKVDDASTKQIELSLKKSVQAKSLFSRVTVEIWSPSVDARNRILSAKERIEMLAKIPEVGWMVKGKANNGSWIIVPEDLEKQTMAFSTFMSHVVGKFTRAYLKEMPYRVEDRWLISLFIHLILNSISVWQKEENESRAFPYV